MVKITLTHKIRLKPTYKQENYFRQACGVARFTWNWALGEWKRQYEACKKPTGLGLKRQFNAIKPVEFPWMYKLPNMPASSLLFSCKVHLSVFSTKRQSILNSRRKEYMTVFI
ncbi:MAG TPA: helix-turn-helix domain-containing protein [bacterium]|nr:helix-turn-helix domain-containing protein [bacterium]